MEELTPDTTDIMRRHCDPVRDPTDTPPVAGRKSTTMRAAITQAQQTDEVLKAKGVKYKYREQCSMLRIHSESTHICTALAAPTVPDEFAEDAAARGFLVIQRSDELYCAQNGEAWCGAWLPV